MAERATGDVAARAGFPIVGIGASAQLIAYTAHAFGRLPASGSISTPKTESAMKKIFVLLRAQTGHDFSQYKPSTIRRRIERRMAFSVSAIIGLVWFFNIRRNEPGVRLKLGGIALGGPKALQA